jgi:hypothetical protein
MGSSLFGVCPACYFPVLTFASLDPIVLHAVLDRKLTRIAFARNAAAVLTGDDHGVVTVYRLRNFRIGETSAGDNLKNLSAILASKRQSGHGEQAQNLTGSNSGINV